MELELGTGGGVGWEEREGGGNGEDRVGTAFRMPTWPSISAP